MTDPVVDGIVGKLYPSEPDHTDPEYVLGAVLAQLEDLEPAQARQVLIDAMTALVAQRTERLATDQKVGGSNPSERAAFVCHCECHLPMGFVLAPGEEPAPIMTPCDKCAADHPRATIHLDPRENEPDITKWRSVPAMEPTTPLDQFLVAYEDDDNEWWRLGSGDHQNLFEEAVERMQFAEAEVARTADFLYTAADVELLVAERLKGA